MRNKILLTSLFFIFIVFIGPIHSHAQSADSVIASAKKYLGVRYVFGGTTPNGFDCSGFLRYVFNEHGINLPRTASEQYKVGTSVAKSQLKKGDLVFFQTYKSGASHSGMYLGNGKFISATSSKGVSIASINDPYYWGSRYLGAKRVLKEKLPTLATGKYHDVPSTFWAYNEITDLGVKKIVNGYDQSLFYPNKTLTRAEAAAIIARVKELPSPSNKDAFPDVSANHWAIEPIYAAVEAGYFGGYEDHTFRPDEPLSREQVATLFNRVFNLEDKDSIVSFNDVNEADWSYNDIETFVAHEITVGFDDNTYRPKSGVSRAQFVVFLHRILKME